MPNHRATEWMLRYGRLYPDAWEYYARVLAEPPEPWPRWCFCPLAASYAVVSRGRNKIPLEESAHVSALGAVAAWRVTQGVYRFDSTLFSELWQTPVRGDLPIDVLERAPEWCVYIEIPHEFVDEALRASGVNAVHGFFAYLEYDINAGRRELRLLLDTGRDADPGGDPSFRLARKRHSRRASRVACASASKRAR